MKDATKTIAEIIDKSSVTIISSIDEDGFPNTKAMLPPRKRNSGLYVWNWDPIFGAGGIGLHSRLKGKKLKAEDCPGRLACSE